MRTSDYEKEQIIDLNRQGYSIRQIADHMAIPKSTIQRWVTGPLADELERPWPRQRKGLKVVVRLRPAARPVSKKNVEEERLWSELREVPVLSPSVRLQSTFPTAADLAQYFPDEGKPKEGLDFSAEFLKARSRISPAALRASENGGIPRELLISRDPRDQGRGEERR